MAELKPLNIGIWLMMLLNCGTGGLTMAEYCLKCGAKFAERWIPVQERLPEEEGQYIVTTTSGKVYIWSFYFSLASKRPYFSGDEKVVAWMPRPKPYEPPKEAI